MSTGSLGQGISAAAGMAKGAKYLDNDINVYTLLGDGEIEEGQVWEAAMFAGAKKLDNLTVIVDNNNLQIDGTCDQVMPNGDLGEKFKSFGWEVLEIDGHDMEEICATLDKCYASKNGKPKCIYAHTIKGKGVSYMENSCSWHGTAPNKEERDQAFEELNAQLIP